MGNNANNTQSTATTLSAPSSSSSSSTTTTTTTTTSSSSAICVPAPPVSDSSTLPSSVNVSITDSAKTIEKELKTTEPKTDSSSTTTTSNAPSGKKKNRCPICNKKVGFSGIECRCGSIFCPLHRYPDQHQCTFDFKTHDRKTLKDSVVGGGEFQKI